MLRDAEGNINIINDATLRIGNYVFPETAGLPGQILVLNEFGDSLKWEFGGSGSSGDGLWERSGDDKDGPNIRNINFGNVIVGPTFPATNARLHVERGDFVVNSSTSGETPIPFEFDDPPGLNSPAAGIMWWGGNRQAFRVGRVDRGEAYDHSLPIDWMDYFTNAWHEENIGASSIGIGTNVVAVSDGTFGLGRNLYIEAPGDPGHPNYPNYSKNSFAIGVDNVVIGENAMIVGGENVIDGADRMSIFGRSNSVSHTPGLTIHTPSLIVGNNNTIEGAEEHVFIFGGHSRVTQASNVLALGTRNTVENIPLAEDMTILIGENNTVNGRLNNILIGTYNRSNADSVIALGSNLHPRANSIFIGRNNTDRSVYPAGRKNIVIGQDIQIHQTTEEKTQNISNNILIGHDIRNTMENHSYFRANHTIAIGNNIQPHDLGTGPAQGADFSVNIGNNIATASTNSVRIGNDIDTRNPTHARNTIAIGRDISFPASTAAGLTIDNGNAIILGTNFPEAYPLYDSREARPRFVVGGITRSIQTAPAGPGPPGTVGIGVPLRDTMYEVNYVYVDDNANFFLGKINHGAISNDNIHFLPDHNRPAGSNMTPLNSSSTIYARAMFLGSTHAGNTNSQAIRQSPIVQPGILTLNSSVPSSPVTDASYTNDGRAQLNVGQSGGRGTVTINSVGVTDNTRAILNVGGGTIPTAHTGGSDANSPSSWPTGSTRGGTIYVPGNAGKAGRIYAQQTVVSGSDRRFKRDIRPIRSGMEEYLYRITPFSYTREGDESNRLQWGFIAQDVQQYFPHLVFEIEEFEDKLGLDYTGFIPVLWKINQDQQLLIDRQQARIEMLERQVRHINDFNADELRRQTNRINALEAQLKIVMERLEADGK
jgi:hypothetical protein